MPLVPVQAVAANELLTDLKTGVRGLRVASAARRPVLLTNATVETLRGRCN